MLLSNGWDEHARAEAANAFFARCRRFRGEAHQRAEANSKPGTSPWKPIWIEPCSFRERPFTQRAVQRVHLRAIHARKTIRASFSTSLTATRRYFLAALNNESAELNAYRIRKFDLPRNFTAFFTSCYLRVRKPDPLIYQARAGNHATRSAGVHLHR